MIPSLYSCLLLLVPGLVALPDIEIQQGRRLYTGYKVLRAHLTSDTDRAAVLQLEDDGGETRSRHPRKFPCWTAKNTTAKMNWKQYQSVDTIYSWLDCMQQHFGHKMSVRDIGRSSEGRPLKLVQIGEGGTNKPAVFIDGGIHAREWVSPAAVTYLIHRMVETEGEYNNLLDKFTVYVLPIVNPDGYEYSREHDRMWRKSRSKTGGRNLTSGDECKGVDLNRNFGYHWGGPGASDDPCKETFRGSGAFSEPESQAIKNFLLSGEANFQLYLSFHSYGQYLLYPWGFDKLDIKDWQDLKRVGDIANNAMRRLNHGEIDFYQVGAAAKMIYLTSGTSRDWAKGGANIKYSYTVELPDTGKFGFLLPARYIIEVGDQATTIVKAMLTEIGN